MILEIYSDIKIGGFPTYESFFRALIIVLELLSDSEKPRGEYVSREPNSSVERFRLLLMKVYLAFREMMEEIQEHLLDQKAIAPYRIISCGS